MNNKINILWIDDNPLQLSTKEIIEKGIKYTLPTFSQGSNFDDYFNLKILQHPEEVREYLSMCNTVLNNYGSTVFEKCFDVVPDIIVIDYMLSQTFDTDNDKAISYTKSNRRIREEFIPNYSLANSFPKLFNQQNLFSENAIGYTKQELFKKINPNSTPDQIIEQDILLTTNDEFGLYAGITILRFFRNHITTALPATQKATKDVLGPVAKYFEWLNEYDLKTAFDRNQRSKKDWGSIVSDGVVLLQQRIISQVKTKAVRLSFENLFEIKSGSADSLEIYSDFLKKDLPLDALFYNIKDPVLKHDSITIFIDNLLNEIFESTDDFRIAENIATTLWDTYTSPKSALRRKLSDLLARAAISKHTITYKSANKEKQDKLIHYSLSKKEYSLLFYLKDLFQIDCDKDQIRSELKKTGDFFLLTKDIKSKKIKRLIYIFIIVKLINRWSLFKANNLELIEGLEMRNSKIGNLEPGYDDLLLALYPVAENPIIFHIHSDLLNEIPGRKSVARTTVRKDWDNRTVALEFKPNEFGVCLDVSSQLTDQERYILKQYLLLSDNEQLLNNSQCPAWIKHL